MAETFVSSDEIRRMLAVADKMAGENKGKRYLVVTLGCQQNEADSENIRGLCERCGYTQCLDEAEADLIIINTCAIREHAENRAFSRTGSFKKLKEAKPTLIIAVCGCMVQQLHRLENIKSSYRFVDFCFGTDRIYTLPEMLENARKKQKRNFYISELPHNEFGIIAEGLPVVRSCSYKAAISIMYGCNNFCSYCIVPFVRGHERSRRETDVLNEVEISVKNGAKEIMLLGQNVNSYKGDNGMTFAKLLEKSASFDGEYLVRFMTSHPKDASEELMTVIGKCDKVAKHFHLPLQSGSNAVLKAMNRKYTLESYLEKVRQIREKCPEISLTTDIICGFPGETEADFQQTLDAVKEVGFDMIYTFLYSARKGTVAAEMPDKIPHEEQVRRFNLLSDLQNSISESNGKKQVGQTVRVLCDGEKDGKKTGRTNANKIIIFDGNASEGEFTDVKITSAAQYILYGEQI